MADKKRPPHPHGPWPSVFPPDGGRPPRPWPPYPMTPPWNDTEPVIGVRPWEECCDGKDECVCVTSGDVDAWYNVYDTVANNSGSWGGASGESGWSDSAAYWNSTYDTVYDSSATWSSGAQRASQLDPELLNELSDILSKSSGFLASYYGLDHVYTKKDVLAGIGTPSDPIDLDWKVKVTLDDMNDALLQLYKDGDPDLKKNWVNVSALKNIYDWLEEHDKLFWKVKPDIPSPYEGDNRKPDGVFDQLEKIWAILRNNAQDIPQSAHWNSTYETVSNSSANWDSAYEISTDLAESADKWNQTYEEIPELEERISDLEDVISDSADLWSEGYERSKRLETSASLWNRTAEELPKLDDRVTTLESELKEGSEVWYDTSDTVAALSGFWNSTHDTVYDLSGSWNEAEQKISESADKWNQTYEVIDSSSGHWNHISETVEENSAAWAKDAFRLEYVENLNYDNYRAYDEPGVIYYNYNKEY